MEAFKDEIIDYKSRINSKKRMGDFGVLINVFIFSLLIVFGIASWLETDVWQAYFDHLPVFRVMIFFSMGTIFGSFFFSLMLDQQCRQINNEELRNVLHAAERNPELKVMLKLIHNEGRRPVADEYHFIMSYGVNKEWENIDSIPSR